MITTLILPGIGNSGPDHWQTRWERLDPAFRRVNQDEWHSPRCEDWIRRLNDAVSAVKDRIVFVAHSSACALVAHWTAQASPENLAKIQGAMLVGPSDPTGPNYPKGPTGFAPVPIHKLPFRSIVVASTDDRYIAIDQARKFAGGWGSKIIVLENAGHINSESGLGDWYEGLGWLKELQSP